VIITEGPDRMINSLKIVMMITKKELLQLSGAHDSFCISIYIPTHRAGKETLNGMDARNLKNQLKGVNQKLGEMDMCMNEI
jgi:hypothetical protein